MLGAVSAGEMHVAEGFLICLSQLPQFAQQPSRQVLSVPLQPQRRLQICPYRPILVSSREHRQWKLEVTAHLMLHSSTSFVRHLWECNFRRHL